MSGMQTLNFLKSKSEKIVNQLCARKKAKKNFYFYFTLNQLLICMEKINKTHYY